MRKQYMLEDLDLDIRNYSVADLETFLRLPRAGKYTHADVGLYESKIRTVLLNSGHVDKRFKRDLISFLEEAKRVIIDNRGLRPPAPSALPMVSVQTNNPKYPQGKAYQLDTVDNPHAVLPGYHREGDLVMRPPPAFTYVQPSEYVQGTVNPLDRRTMTKCLTVDTKYRDQQTASSSTDFTFQLPIKFQKVVSMKLSSFEIPVAFYGISEYYGNNYLYIRLVYENLATNNDEDLLDDFQVLEIPEGNYNAQDLVDLLNSLICPKTETGDIINTDSIFSYVEFVLDISPSGSGSGKLAIQPTGTHASKVQRILLDFRMGINGVPDGKDYTTKIGWNLGFTREVYDSGDAGVCISDTIVEPAAIRYLFLVVDDFNNNMNNPYISAFNQSLMTPNILARISIKGAYFSILMENDLSVVSEARQYFGPVDIQRLRVRLIDDRGRTVDMNGANYSFCLLFTQLYDI